MWIENTFTHLLYWLLNAKNWETQTNNLPSSVLRVALEEWEPLLLLRLLFEDSEAEQLRSLLAGRTSISSSSSSLSTGMHNMSSWSTSSSELLSNLSLYGEERLSNLSLYGEDDDLHLGFKSFGQHLKQFKAFQHNVCQCSINTVHLCN